MLPEEEHRAQWLKLAEVLLAASCQLKLPAFNYASLNAI